MSLNNHLFVDFFFSFILKQDALAIAPHGTPREAPSSSTPDVCGAAAVADLFCALLQA
jgi:hypothetical protein